jgi:hypothetical protein
LAVTGPSEAIRSDLQPVAEGFEAIGFLRLAQVSRDAAQR